MLRSAVDVLIVGAGPAGLFAAARLARAGARTVVCEEHATIGEPVHCTGIVAAESFAEFDLPHHARLNSLETARFVSPSGIEVTHRTLAPLAFVIDRSAFDRSLASRAVDAGAEVRVGAHVSAVEIDAAGARVLVGEDWVHARLLVLACGASYATQRRLGLGLPKTYLHTAQREMPVGRLCDLELHFGRNVAPDGFAWAVPVVRAEGPHVRVGVMAARDAVGCYRRMVAAVRGAWELEDDQGPPRQRVLPLGVIERTYGDRLLVIGDAAGLVKPTTGGGVHYGIVSAVLAADVAADALRRDRLDAKTLSAYEGAWQRQLSEEFDAQHALRDVVTKLSDEAIDSFFELANTDGIMPIVRATVRFNRHRELIRALFRHPPARRALFQALAG
jgi:geranylgeranyl reductase family protein